MTDDRDGRDWHPEPELVFYGDEATSRAAMERLGADTWATALDFLYDQAAHRAMGDPAPYAELRATFFGATGGPAPAPRSPAPIADVLAEFRDRLAGGQMNPQHPRQFGYFTPPPLPASMMGELLAQMTNQGVDVWHAGPLATFVEEEVVRWLCDLVGYGPDVVRAADLGRGDGQLHGHDPGPGHPPRAPARGRAGAARRGCSTGSVSTPRTRPISRSLGRSTCWGSRPRRW